MKRQSHARKQRRVLKAAGIELMDRVTIEGAAIYLMTDKGITLADIIAYQIAGSLERLASNGADLLGTCAITIGTHPDYPSALTIESKAASKSHAQKGKDNEG